jgi:geranylgeranyl pyrophosphate synthase
VYTQPGLKNRVQQLREACDLAAGIEYAQRRASSLVEGALARVQALPHSAARQALEGVASFMLERRW